MDKLLKKIGWIGTGVMGKPMCLHLIKSGYNVSIYNRTLNSNTDELTNHGAKLFTNISDMAVECDIIFIMVGNPTDVENLVLNPENGIIKNIKPGSFIIDHTTSSPQLAKKIFTEMDKIGVSSWDAPVSGGDIGARNGNVVVMAGGPSKNFDEIKTIMSAYSQNIIRFGNAGSGQHTKMTNQIIVAGNLIGTCEGLLYAYKAGIDQLELHKLLSGGAASSFVFNRVGGKILQGEFEPGIYIEHYIKDLGIAIGECKNMGIKLEGLEMVYRLYEIMMEEGSYERKGAHILYEGLKRMNKMYNI